MTHVFARPEAMRVSTNQNMLARLQEIFPNQVCYRGKIHPVDVACGGCASCERSHATWLRNACLFRSKAAAKIKGGLCAKYEFHIVIVRVNMLTGLTRGFPDFLHVDDKSSFASCKDSFRKTLLKNRPLKCPGGYWVASFQCLQNRRCTLRRWGCACRWRRFFRRAACSEGCWQISEPLTVRVVILSVAHTGDCSVSLP